MPKLPELVTKKIGPLPLWSYVVIGGVLVFILRKRGGSSSGSSAGGIGIPVLTPSGSTSGASGGSIGSGGNAVGSPGQNVQGGSDTQPGGAPPHWVPAPETIPSPAPLPFLAAPVPTARSSPGGNPGGATTGVLPDMAAFDRMNLYPSAVPEGGFTPAQQAGLIESAQRLGGAGGSYNGPPPAAYTGETTPAPSFLASVLDRIFSPAPVQQKMQPVAQGWTPDPTPVGTPPAGYSRLLDASTGTYYLKPFVDTPEPQGRWDKSN